MPKIRKKQPRVIYPGSTIMQNYGESGDKGFLLWDIQTRDSWTVDFYPVLNNSPFVTVDWTGDIDTTVQACIAEHPNGAKYRIKSKRIIDPKTQHKLSGQLRRDLNAKEVVFKVEASNDVISLSEETTEKLEVLNLSSPQVHKELLREYASDENHTEEFWAEVDRVIDTVVPQLEYTASYGKKWSIKRLEFDNLFGYGEGNSIDLQKTHGLVGLFGQNRAGKSSIPGSIMYGLFNSNDRGLTTNAHVVNYRKTYGSANITLDVDGKAYRVERLSNRYISRRHGTNGAKTDLNLYVLDEDGQPLQDLSGEQRRETEKDLKDLVGGPEEFMMTTFAAQGNMNAFLDKGATDRKKLLSSFMGLDILDELYKKIKNEGDGIKALIKRGAQDWDGDISSMSNKIGLLSENKEVLESQKIDISTKLQDYELKLRESSGASFIDPLTISSKENTLEKFRKTLANNVDTIKLFEQELESVEQNIEKYETLRDRIPLENLKRRIEMYETLQKTMISLEGQLKREEATLNTQQRSVKLLEEVPCGTLYPSCKFISDSHKNKKLMEQQLLTIKNLQEEYSTMSDQLEHLANEDLKSKLDKYEKLVVEIQRLKIKRTQLDSQLEIKTNQLSVLEKDIQALDEEITTLKLQASDSDSEAHSKLKSIIENLRAEVKSIENKIYSDASQIGLLRAKIDNLTEEKHRYEILEKEWEVYEFLLRATSWKGIPTFVMTKQIPRINTELNKILRDVTGFTIELEVDEKNTDIYINYGDTRRPLECGSGMEKMVSSMALRVALSNVSNLSKSDMFIVDEGFGALDSENVEAVTSLLHRLKDYYRLILVISHVDVIKDNVDDVIIIERNGQDSKVIYN